MQNKKTPTTPTLKVSDLRIGNLIEYETYDSLKLAKTEWVENVVDIQDLQFLNKFPDYPHYRPMKLTEDILVRFGFEEHPNDIPTYAKGWGTCDDEDFAYAFLIYQDIDGNWYFQKSPIKIILESAHQLQNLYFALTGEELQFRDREELTL